MAYESAKKVSGTPLWSVRMRASRGKVHVSGAEGLFGEEELQEAASGYLRRALGHPKGMPESISISIERLRKRPQAISALPLLSLACGSPKEARLIIKRLLLGLGLSGAAVQRALGVVYSKDPMRGAALISAERGTRLEPEPSRGVRVSRLGIEKSALRTLSRGLSRLGINQPSVREALVLASKVSSIREVIAELCVSDDPDYTTGYVASRGLGYVRIPNIKEPGNSCGGRAFLVHENADTKKTMEHLEQRPVIVNRISTLSGRKTIDELLGAR